MTIEDIKVQYYQTLPSNLAEFLTSIRTGRMDGSLGTISVIAFLDSVIDGFLPEGRMMCANLDTMQSDLKDYLEMQTRIVAAQMVLLFESRSFAKLSSRTLLFLEYASHTVKGDYDFSSLAIETLSYPYETLGFSWSNIEQAPFLSTLVHQFFRDSKRNTTTPFPRFNYAGKGQVIIDNGKLSIYSSPVSDSAAVAFTVCNGKAEIATRNTRDERLKVTDAELIEKLDDFSRTFVKTQKEFSKNSSQMNLRELNIGEKYSICCTGLDEENGLLLCSPLGVRGDYEGEILNESLMKGLNTEDLIDFIFDNDCISGAELVEDGDRPVFSIKESYREYARKKADKDFRDNLIIEAQVIAVLPKIDRVNWITSGGYGAISVGVGNLEIDDISKIEVMNFQNSSDLYINVRYPKVSTNRIDRKFDSDDVLKDFVKSYQKASEEIKFDPSLNQSEAEQIQKIRSLSRILSHNLVGNSLENYRRLLLSEFLSETISDSTYTLYPKSRASFLANCIALAQKKQLSPWKEDMSPLAQERLILRGVSYFFNSEDVNGISKLLSECKKGTKEHQLTQLMLAKALSTDLPDEIRTTSEQFRTKIADILGVSDMLTCLDKSVAGKYGFESETVEFKASYVMRNDGKGADIDRQGRGEVFQAVCGFLNKDGGTVYIGVNNSGDPITSSSAGLNLDMQWLTENYMHILEKRIRQLGHPVPKADNLDHYALFLNDEKELYFKPSLKDYISIAPTEDGDAIKITVRPSRFEIAVLYTDTKRTDGMAYVRDGQETIPMSRVQQEQRLMTLKSVGRKVEFILTLQEAIDKQRKVLLKDYSSGSNSGSFDRLIVPINFSYGDDSVYCFDVMAKGFKQYMLSRIGEIDSNLEEPDYPHAFEPKYADIFRWISNDRYHIKIKMDITAKNSLCDEYPAVNSLAEDSFYYLDEEQMWVLDTELQGLEAMRRFYMGYADRIEILESKDSDKLIKYIKEFCDSSLTF